MKSANKSPCIVCEYCDDPSIGFDACGEPTCGSEDCYPVATRRAAPAVEAPITVGTRSFWQALAFWRAA